MAGGHIFDNNRVIKISLQLGEFPLAFCKVEKWGCRIKTNGYKIV